MDEMNDETGAQGPTEPTREVVPSPGAPTTDPTTAQLPTAAPVAAYAVPSGPPIGQPGSGSSTPPGPGYSGPWQSSWAPPHTQWAPPPFEPPKRRGSAFTIVALVLSVALLLGAGILIGHGLWTRDRSANAFAPIPQTPATPTLPSSGGTSGGTGSGGPSNAASIASKVDPGLVDINTSLSYQQAQAAGTGMVLTSSGEVLTNNHVIQGATNITVTDVGNGKTYGATVVGYDISGDLAILQLHGASGLQTVTPGNSSNLSVGESVVGVGNAGGTGGTPSFAGGSVTALNQSIAASDQFNTNAEQLTGLIESSAGIQPGDSGGPLVTSDGRVIGIDTAASSGLQFQTGNGVSYAIPINTAIKIARQIEASESSTTVHIGATAFLGLEVTPVGGTGGLGGGTGTGSGQGGSQQAGVGVAGVVTGQPADQAGIAAGDVITSVAGTTVDTPHALTTVLQAHHPGDKVVIAWTDQSGQTHNSTVQLASGPPQ